jgi:hypothetical protein
MICTGGVSTEKALPGKYKIEVHYFSNSQMRLAEPTTIHALMYTN